MRLQMDVINREGEQLANEETSIKYAVKMLNRL